MLVLPVPPCSSCWRNWPASPEAEWNCPSSPDLSASSHRSRTSILQHNIQGHVIIIKELWSKCRRFVYPKRVKIEIPLFMGKKNTDHTHNHTFISFSFLRYVEADFKKYCLDFKCSIKYTTL